MKAGREMDALVAEKVMGWTDRHGEFAIPPDTSPHRGAIRYMPEKVPPYSTDISAAWQVVEKLWELKYCVIMKNFPNFDCLHDWVVIIEQYREEPYTKAVARHYEKALPELISLAALKACGVEVE